MNTRDGAPAALQGRELQEAAVPVTVAPGETLARSLLLVAYTAVSVRLLAMAFHVSAIKVRADQLRVSNCHWFEDVFHVNRLVIFYWPTP
jgi:hypothetical protein